MAYALKTEIQRVSKVLINDYGSSPEYPGGGDSSCASNSRTRAVISRNCQTTSGPGAPVESEPNAPKAAGSCTFLPGGCVGGEENVRLRESSLNVFSCTIRDSVGKWCLPAALVLCKSESSNALAFDGSDVPASAEVMVGNAVGYAACRRRRRSQTNSMVSKITQIPMTIPAMAPVGNWFRCADCRSWGALIDEEVTSLPLPTLGAVGDDKVASVIFCDPLALDDSVAVCRTGDPDGALG